MRRRATAPAGLTPRVVEVLRLIATGSTTAQVANRLQITQKTADHNIQYIYTKINTSNRLARDPVRDATRTPLIAIEIRSRGRDPCPRSGSMATERNWQPPLMTPPSAALSSRARRPRGPSPGAGAGWRARNRGPAADRAGPIESANVVTGHVSKKPDQTVRVV